jgi:hypothetical protein
MNNLTQTQTDAKQAYLNRQSEQMLALYAKADTEEWKAIIKQIDSFLSVVSPDAKTFWLKFRRKLETLNEQSSVLFPLGEVYLTIGAQDALEESNQAAIEFLARHQKGDWGIVGKEDWKENELSVKEGFRILSSYKTSKGVKIWIITECDRSATTILLPEDY